MKNDSAIDGLRVEVVGWMLHRFLIYRGERLYWEGLGTYIAPENAREAGERLLAAIRAKAELRDQGFYREADAVFLPWGL